MKEFSAESYNELWDWQDTYITAKSQYGTVLNKLEKCDELLRGTSKIRKGSGYSKEGAKTVRNICYELVEAQVDSNIPMPKVTATKEKQVDKARKIENKLRNEIDRLPFEKMNDIMERITPAFGGSLFWIDWNNFERTHNTVGELEVRVLHPKQFIPQPGVYEIEEMDYFFIELSQTKGYIWNRYKINVNDETEETPTARSYEPEHSDDKVTQIIVYYRNKSGGIGKFSWVNDIILEDLEDYQSRIIRRCSKCGLVGWEDECSVCGSKKFVEETLEKEKIYYNITDKQGNIIIPAGSEVPYYKPNIYPVVLRRNVSNHGTFLGKSDIEVIKDMQETIKKLETDCLEKLLAGGSYFMQPEGKRIKTNDENLKVVEISSPQEKSMFDVFDVQCDISKNMAFIEDQYQRARQIIGITDSFQGRKDSTATSGTAKQFSAAQSAGRLESKKIMKKACYADLYEVMIKFLVAFADEPRPILTYDEKNVPMFEEFSKYDFLERDQSGEWYYNLEYLFSTDTSASLASNREAMWQETRMNLQQGAFGDPTSSETLLTFWSMMETLHYPSASMLKARFENMVNTQAQMQQMGQEIESLKNNNAQLVNALNGAKDFIMNENGNGRIDVPQENLSEPTPELMPGQIQDSMEQ